MNKLNLLLENLKNKENFKILFNNNDLELEYWKYFEDDNCYHGILNEYIIGRLTINDMKKAIVDNNSYIKLEII